MSKIDLTEAKKELHENLIPKMTNTVMDAFELGFETGFKAAKEAVTNRACALLKTLRIEVNGRVISLSEEHISQYRTMLVTGSEDQND